MQSDGDVTLAVDPVSLAGVFIGALVGTNTFTGDVDGDDVSLSVTGTRQNTASNCTFTFNAEIDAVQDGDTMKGRIEYRAATNGDADCAHPHGLPVDPGLQRDAPAQVRDAPEGMSWA